MKPLNKPLTLATCIFVFVLFSPSLYGQSDGSMNYMSPVMLFGIFELPILFLCVFYSFKTAQALKGGIFGTGMNYLAWGFLVMAVGHIAMQIHNLFMYDVFRDPFGPTLGNVLWFIALIVTWGLSAFGFYSIYKVSKK